MPSRARHSVVVQAHVIRAWVAWLGWSDLRLAEVSLGCPPSGLSFVRSPEVMCRCDCCGSPSNKVEMGIIMEESKGGENAAVLWGLAVALLLALAASWTLLMHSCSRLVQQQQRHRRRRTGHHDHNKSSACSDAIRTVHQQSVRELQTELQAMRHQQVQVRSQLTALKRLARHISDHRRPQPLLAADEEESDKED